MRRWWRSPSEKDVFKKVSTKRTASSAVCIRAPTLTRLASLCSRASAAVSSLHARAQRAPADLVGRHLLAVAGAADDDTEGVAVRHGALGGTQAEGRVVVVGVVDVRAAVDRLVVGGLQPLDEVVLQFVTGMIGAEVHAHASECGIPVRHPWWWGRCAGQPRKPDTASLYAGRRGAHSGRRRRNPATLHGVSRNVVGMFREQQSGFGPFQSGQNESFHVLTPVAQRPSEELTAP